jgi:hypothetical protein
VWWHTTVTPVRLAQARKTRPYPTKRAAGLVQVVEYPLNKPKALNSNLSTAKIVITIITPS